MGLPRSLTAALLLILKVHWATLLKGLVLVILANGLLILNPVILRYGFNILYPQTAAPSEHPLSTYLSSYSVTHSVFFWVGLLLCASFASSYLRYYMRLMFFTVSTKIEEQVREDLFARIQGQSQAFFDRHGGGELLSRLTNDISAYRDLVGPGLMYPTFAITLVVPALFVLFSFSVPLAIIALVPIVILPFVHFAVRHIAYRAAYATQGSLAEMSNLVQEHYSGIRLIKSYAVESSSTDQLNKLSTDFLKHSLKFSNFQGVIFPFFTLISRMVTVALVLCSAGILLLGWGTLSAADFVAFMWLQSYVFFPILMLGWMLPIYHKGSAAYHRLAAIYAEVDEVEKEETKSVLSIPPQAAIELKHLTFCYPGTTLPALNDLNIVIPGGSFVGITGAVGSGKTTLFRLLSRDYEISRGMISIGGHDIHDYSLNEFRTQMVTVEQVTFLFSRSMADNVRFAKEDATQEDLERVARYASLHETVLEFPDSYETIVGERGATLSGGQKQRVAIARAFLVDRSILLLDDIFSAVDSATQKQILHSIKTHFQGKTVLLITHRVSVLDQMDQILYLKNGRLVETGPPQELRQRKQYYATLADLQELGG